MPHQTPSTSREPSRASSHADPTSLSSLQAIAVTKAYMILRIFTPIYWHELTIPTFLLMIRPMGATLPLLPKDSAPLGQGQRGAVLCSSSVPSALTAKELASRLGLSLNAVRHHLKELEAEGPGGYERQHRGVGAPVFAYRLSAGGRGALSAALRGDADRRCWIRWSSARAATAAVALLESYFAGSPAGSRRAGGAPPAERLQVVGRVLSRRGIHGRGARPRPAAAR